MMRLLTALAVIASSAGDPFERAGSMAASKAQGVKGKRVSERGVGHYPDWRRRLKLTGEGVDLGQFTVESTAAQERNVAGNARSGIAAKHGQRTRLFNQSHWHWASAQNRRKSVKRASADQAHAEWAFSAKKLMTWRTGRSAGCGRFRSTSLQRLQTAD